MSWKKNKFSYVMWFLYTLFSVVVLMLATETQAEKMFGQIPFGGLIPGFIIAVLAGFAVYLRQWLIERRKNKVTAHSSASENASYSHNSSKSGVLWEIVAAVILLALGLIIRLDRLSGAEGEFSTYYKTAMVLEGQVIPPVVHGADFLYLQLLHTLFLFVGNKFVAAVWFQIILQFLAALLLYIGMRRMAGPAASLVTLGFFMLAGSMIDRSVTLSPQMMVLLLFVIGINFLGACQRGKSNQLAFLGVGIWIGLMGYLDIGGFLLLPLLIFCAVSDRIMKEERGKKLGALGFSFLGTLISFLGALEADTFISGKSFGNIINAWLGLYSPGNFQSSVLFDHVITGWWIVVLAVFQIAGVFSFWYDREKDYMSMWVLGGCVTVAAGCFGMFTEELPMYPYLFLFLVILAGVGTGVVYREPIEESQDVEESEEAQIVDKEEAEMMEKKKRKEKNRKKEKNAAIVPEQDVTAEETTPLSVKMPKYMREAGSGRVIIPAYMRPEENKKITEAVMEEAESEETFTESPAYGVAAEEEPERQYAYEAQPEAEPVKPSSSYEALQEEETMESSASKAVSEEGKSSTFRRLGETALPVAAADTEEAEQEKDKTGNEIPVADSQVEDAPAVPDTVGESVDNPDAEESKSPKYIENPLPLPKPHVKRIMDYARKPSPGEDDYDHPVSDDDDFDI